MATQVILTEAIADLGAEADIVSVKPGYARNYLIPQNKAMEVTPSSLRHLDHLKAKRAQREAQELIEAESLASKINKMLLTLELETGESGKAFGSITAHDLITRVEEELKLESKLPRHAIVLERPIKESGEKNITMQLHPQVEATLRLTIIAKGKEEEETH